MPFAIIEPNLFYNRSTEESADVHRNKYRNEWLVDNVTGFAVGKTIEYRVNRNNLQLRLSPGENRKYLSLSTYAGNRVGRGPHTYLGSENTNLLRHPWWWHGDANSAGESSTGPSGTSSTGKTYKLFSN